MLRGLRSRHEVEVLENGEADLHRHWTQCQKNPGHKEFIPVDDFKISNLPIGYRKQDILNITKAISNLTVRIAVKYTSKERPQYYPGTHNDYPFYSDAGSDKMRTGSGYVSHVNIFHGKNCSCNICERSGNHALDWGEVMISTATHVVFNAEEAQNTSFRLFFDCQDSPVICIEGVHVEHVNVEKDMTRVKCVTHDVELLRKLEAMVENWEKLSQKVHEQYKEWRLVDRLTIIASHPHGCSKQVSVGEWRERTKIADGDSWFTYTTCTCPGSSGAFVYILGSRWWYWYHDHVHSGANDDGVNYSTVGYDDFEH